MEGGGVVEGGVVEGGSVVEGGVVEGGSGSVVEGGGVVEGGVVYSSSSSIGPLTTPIAYKSSSAGSASTCAAALLNSGTRVSGKTRSGRGFAKAAFTSSCFGKSKAG